MTLELNMRRTFAQAFGDKGNRHDVQGHTVCFRSSPKLRVHAFGSADYKLARHYAATVGFGYGAARGLQRSNDASQGVAPIRETLQNPIF